MMNNFKRRLTQRELYDILEQLPNNQPQADDHFTILHDKFGNPHIVKGSQSNIIIDNNQFPKVVNENHLQIADCGHALHNNSEIGGMCDFGHLVCKNEQLLRCSLCGALMCELDVIFDENNMPICPNHSSDMNLPLLVGVIVVIIGAVLALSNI